MIQRLVFHRRHRPAHPARRKVRTGGSNTSFEFFAERHDGEDWTRTAHRARALPIRIEFVTEFLPQLTPALAGANRAHESPSSTPPVVGIIMGSSSDWPTMEHAAQVLAELRSAL